MLQAAERLRNRQALQRGVVTNEKPTIIEIMTNRECRRLRVLVVCCVDVVLCTGEFELVCS